MTLLALRIGNDVTFLTQITDDIHFAWQVQYLVRLEGDFSWQAQQFVTFWEIAGPRNVVFFHTKCVSRMGRVRSLKRRVRDDDFINGYPRISSDYPRIVFLLAEALQTLSLEIYAEKFSGRRSIW